MAECYSPVSGERRPPSFRGAIVGPATLLGITGHRRFRANSPDRFIRPAGLPFAADISASGKMSGRPEPAGGATACRWRGSNAGPLASGPAWLTACRQGGNRPGGERREKLLRALHKPPGSHGGTTALRSEGLRASPSWWTCCPDDGDAYNKHGLARKSARLIADNARVRFQRIADHREGTPPSRADLLAAINGAALEGGQPSNNK